MLNSMRGSFITLNDPTQLEKLISTATHRGYSVHTKKNISGRDKGPKINGIGPMIK
jgi:hypothetical protein